MSKDRPIGTCSKFKASAWSSSFITPHFSESSLAEPVVFLISREGTRRLGIFALRRAGENATLRPTFLNGLGETKDISHGRPEPSFVARPRRAMHRAAQTERP